MGTHIRRSSILACIVALFSLAAPAQTVTVSPTSISFGNHVEGTTSAVQKVTLTNGQTSAITIRTITTSLSDYSATNNCPVSPSTLAAAASCTISITFKPSAVGTRSGTLTVIDTGASSPQNVSLTGTGMAPSLTSIAVTPGDPSVAAGQVQQFTATGTYNNGSKQNLTSIVTWTSSATTVATVSARGLATSVAKGKATITASSGTISGATTLTVTAAVLTSIAVTPASPSVADGQTEQFTATGTYSNGTTQNLTSTASWTSSATTVATMSASGLASTLSRGSSTITATSGTIHGATTLTVTAAVLTSIAVTPASPSVAAGFKQQFTATGTYSNGTTQKLTSTASWTSSASTVATVSASGLASTLSRGSSTITATSGTIHGATTLTVTAAVLTSIAVTPASSSVAAGQTEQFTATGIYSNGTTQNLTSTASWTSSATTVATVSASGLASGLAVGTASITATSGTFAGSATLSVGQAVLMSIAVTPANGSFALGTTLPMVATGTYSDGSTLVLTTTATWNTGDTTIATVNDQGLASSAGVGNTTVTATVGAISGSTTVTVNPAALVSIAVTPAIPTIPLGTTQQFTATGTFTDSSTQNITGTVQWSSGAPTVGKMSTTPGLVSSEGTGIATITATSGSISGSTQLTVSAAALVSIAVTPADVSIALGTTQQFTATGTYTDQSTQNLTGLVTWSSDTPTAVTIQSSGGLAQGQGQGTATVSAALGTVSGSTQLTVTAAALVSIAITPATATIPLGTTQQFTATGTYTDGSTQDLTRNGQWTSSAGTVATISDSPGTMGLASPLTTGTTTIAISSGGVSATASLVVNPAALISIAISPPAASIALGATQQFTATGTYTDQSTQDLTSVATWSSSSTSAAIISNTLGSYGLATSAGQGTTTITATSNAISASSTLTVTGPNLVSIAIAPSSAAIPLGESLQFDAVGTYTDGSTQDLTQTATWASSVPTVAGIGAPGYIGSLLPGSTVISATSQGINGLANVTVTASVTLDDYGGITQLPSPNGASGFFRLEIMNNHWTLIDPLGNAFFLLGVDGLGTIGYNNFNGISYITTVTTKYGDDNKTWGPAQVQRLKSWGFNTVATYNNPYVLPTTNAGTSWPGDHYNPQKMPFLNYTLKTSYYGMLNSNQYVSEPIKNFQFTINTEYDTEYIPPAGEADYEDPKFLQYLDGMLASDSSMSALNTASNPYRQWLIGMTTDEADQTYSFNTGTDFPTSPTGHGHAHGGYRVAICSPIQTANSSKSAIYSDTTVHNKMAWTAYLQSLSKYQTNGVPDILKLNAAWKSNYTTWNSSGSSVTGASLGTGDGSNTTFLANLSPNPISKYSLQILVAGSPVGGDQGDGSIWGPNLSGTINYTTGALTVTFAAGYAPANLAAVTTNYVAGGWGVGTGLLDEDGRNTSWIRDRQR